MALTVIPLETGDLHLLHRATLANLNWSGERFREEDLERPEFRHYTHLDAGRGDFGFVALVDGARVGIVWLLHLPSTDRGYGYIDEETPELSIWTAPQHRGHGIGRALLRHALIEAQRRGLRRVSLSVEHGNPARALYMSEGFRDAPGQEPGVMVRDVPTPGQPFDTHGWTTNSTREIYTNPWISVREDAVTRPDGGDGIYGVVTMQNPAVFVVAVDDDGSVLMVSLYRYATRSMSLEVPAGGCDGDDPLVAAQRELLEETGFVAREWREIGRMNALNGVCDATEFVYLATGLTHNPTDGAIPGRSSTTAGQVDVAAEQAAEGIDAVRFVPWSDAMNAIRSGEVSDGETVASLMYAALALGCL